MLRTSVCGRCSQGLVDAHGRTRAARVLGVNYHTVVANLEAGRLSRRMRSALQAYQEPEAGPGHRVADPVAREKPEPGPGLAVEETVAGKWQPPGRAPGLPGAGVVSLEHWPDEEHTFGPAAELLAEWRELRTGGTTRAVAWSRRVPRSAGGSRSSCWSRSTA